MKEFKPIAMRCNQKQYAEIKQILLDNGCKCGLDGTFEERPYLTNNFSSNKNYINNTVYGLRDDYGRTVFETWNKNTFLEYCGIKIKNEYKVGDYVITKGYSKDYDGVPLKINEITVNGCCYFDKTNYHDWQPTHNFHSRHIVRKATIDEIFNSNLPNNNKLEYVEYINDRDRSWIKNKIYKTDNGLIKYESGQLCTETIESLIKQNYFKPSTKKDFDTQNSNIKQSDLDALLIEAKKRYPIGTQFKPAHVISGINVVTEENFYWENDRKNCILITSKNLKENYLGVVYKNGRWAEIIEPAKPVETKSKYQIAAEEALKRFSDIQIGDEYMTIRGNTHIANKLPRIVEDGSDTFIDCGNGYLWRFDEPDLFGYKINTQNNIKTDAYPLPPNPLQDAINLYSNSLLNLQGINYYDRSSSLFDALDCKSSLKKIQPNQLIIKKKIVMDTKINPTQSINTNLKIKK